MLGIVVTLGFAGPVVRAAPDDDPAIGIVWRGEATGPSAIRQRLSEAVAQSGLAGDAEPRRVIDRADQHARVTVAVDLSRDRADAAVRLAERLGTATSSFREGDLVGAAAEVDAVLLALGEAPILPGAAALAIEAHVLRAQIAWTAGDPKGPRESLAMAVALDPDGELSTRRVPPAIATIHEEVRLAAVAKRGQWLPIAIEADAALSPLVVEIDGRPGRRPVPPGQHFLVVRRPGRAGLGFFVEAGATVTVPDQDEIIASGLPGDVSTAEAICDYAGVDQLVLAVEQDRRLALEGYVCGEGFVATWFSEPFPVLGRPPGPAEPDLRAGVVQALAASGNTRPRSRLGQATAWPAPKRATVREPRAVVGTRGEVDRVPAKPWFKRVWVWSLIGGAVIAGVTTGAVLGTRQRPPEVRVDADTFIPTQ